jgi:uncharacterized membrane protein
MKKILSFPPLIAFGIVFVLGCTNDSSSDLIDRNQFDEVTYTNSIKSIIDNNCISCHATTPVNGASTSLTTYADVRNSILNRDLLIRISRAQGAPGMMPSGGTRIPQEKIDQVYQWAENGFPE